MLGLTSRNSYAEVDLNALEQNYLEPQVWLIKGGAPWPL